jgi:hypothetical protein
MTGAMEFSVSKILWTLTALSCLFAAHIEFQYYTSSAEEVMLLKLMRLSHF